MCEIVDYLMKHVNLCLQWCRTKACFGPIEMWLRKCRLDAIKRNRMYRLLDLNQRRELHGAHSCCYHVWDPFRDIIAVRLWVIAPVALFKQDGGKGQVNI